MLKRYFDWLREILPRHAWESLEPELNFLEDSLPHLKEAKKPWLIKLITMAWWIMGLTITAVCLCFMQPLLSTILGIVIDAVVKTKEQKTSALIALIMATSILLSATTKFLKASQE